MSAPQFHSQELMAMEAFRNKDYAQAAKLFSALGGAPTQPEDIVRISMRHATALKFVDGRMLEAVDIAVVACAKLPQSAETVECLVKVLQTALRREAQPIAACYRAWTATRGLGLLAEGDSELRSCLFVCVHKALTAGMEAEDREDRAAAMAKFTQALAPDAWLGLWQELTRDLTGASLDNLQPFVDFARTHRQAFKNSLLDEALIIFLRQRIEQLTERKQETAPLCLDLADILWLRHSADSAKQEECIAFYKRCLKAARPKKAGAGGGGGVGAGADPAAHARMVALANSGLGQAYFFRATGPPQENFEHAISHTQRFLEWCKAGSQSPAPWVRANAVLGLAYYRLQSGNAETNIRRAILHLVCCVCHTTEKAYRCPPLFYALASLYLRRATPLPSSEGQALIPDFDTDAIPNITASKAANNAAVNAAINATAAATAAAAAAALDRVIAAPLAATRLSASAHNINNSIFNTNSNNITVNGNGNSSSKNNTTSSSGKSNLGDYMAASATVYAALASAVDAAASAELNSAAATGGVAGAAAIASNAESALVTAAVTAAVLPSGRAENLRLAYLFCEAGLVCAAAEAAVSSARALLLALKGVILSEVSQGERLANLRRAIECFEASTDMFKALGRTCNVNHVSILTALAHMEIVDSEWPSHIRKAKSLLEAGFLDEFFQPETEEAAATAAAAAAAAAAEAGDTAAADEAADGGAARVGGKGDDGGAASAAAGTAAGAAAGADGQSRGKDGVAAGKGKSSKGKGVSMIKDSVEVGGDKMMAAKVMEVVMDRVPLRRLPCAGASGLIALSDLELAPLEGVDRALSVAAAYSRYEKTLAVLARPANRTAFLIHGGKLLMRMGLCLFSARTSGGRIAPADYAKALDHFREAEMLLANSPSQLPQQVAFAKVCRASLLVEFIYHTRLLGRDVQENFQAVGQALMLGMDAMESLSPDSKDTQSFIFEALRGVGPEDAAANALRAATSAAPPPTRASATVFMGIVVRLLLGRVMMTAALINKDDALVNFADWVGTGAGMMENALALLKQAEALIHPEAYPSAYCVCHLLLYLFHMRCSQIAGSDGDGNSAPAAAAAAAAAGAGASDGGDAGNLVASHKAVARQHLQNALRDVPPKYHAQASWIYFQSWCDVLNTAGQHLRLC
eukprot:m.95367 g.95367  ORF g.95367 m.95367 type:complete len:1152 (+) comp15447_c0_seq1:285-3740(+)